MTIQLSELLMSVPLDRAHFALVDVMADGAAGFEGSRRIRTHLVLTGEARLLHAEGSELLGPGDFVITARGVDHVIAGAEGNPAHAAPQPDHGRATDQIERLVCGEARTRACTVLTATLGLEVSTPRATGEGMPQVLVMHGGSFVLPGHTAGGEPESLAASCAGPGGRAVAAAVMNLLYIHAVRMVYLSEASDHSWPEHLRQRHLGVEAALRLLQRRYGEQWTLASMASAVGMSRTAFALAFHNALGRAPGAHLSELRLEAAARLLAEGVLSVTEIAHAVGFRSQAAFSRAFRRHHGLSPGNIAPRHRAARLADARGSTLRGPTT